MRRSTFGVIFLAAIVAGCSGGIVHEYPVSPDEAKNSGDNYKTVADSYGSIIDAIGGFGEANQRSAGRRVGWVVYKSDQDENSPPSE